MRICSKCSQDAVITLPYASLDLCKQCFLAQVEQRVLRTNRRFKLIEKGDRVAVAFSGGKDSTALLALLAEITPKLRAQLLPVYVDVGIKGYSSEACEHARKFCETLGLELNVVSFKKEFGFAFNELPKRDAQGRGACAYCGVLKRRALNNFGKEAGATKVALAHNLDDVAETFLMNVVRGNREGFTRFAAAGGVLEDGGLVKRIRPLAFVPEEECLAYCELRGLEFYDKKCPHKRNAFRRKAEAFLNELEAKHPGTKFAVARTALALQTQLAMQGKQNNREIRRCSKCGEPSSCEVCKACELLEEIKKC